MEKEWIHFEMWIEDVQVVGFANCENIEVETLEFIDYDGFECGTDFSKTNPVGEVAHSMDETLRLYKWCLIEDFFSKVDIRPVLAAHAEESAVVTYGTGDSIKLKLYINCSPIEQYDGDKDWGFDDSLGCFVRYGVIKMEDIVLFDKEVDDVAFKVTIPSEEYLGEYIYTPKLFIDEEIFSVDESEVVKVIRAIATSDDIDDVLSHFKDIWWDNIITQYIAEEYVK